MSDHEKYEPDHTAVRVALWRALHLEIESPPYVFKDDIALKLANPDLDWRQRPDMDPQGTKGFRAAIVARARFVEDFIEKEVKHGLEQFVILGAGLDTYALRKENIASKFTVYEIDQSETQAWKKQRLSDLGFDIPVWLRFVPVDFETESWWDKLNQSSFDPRKKTVVACIGVTQYLSKEATLEILQKAASMSSGSNLLMTYFLPVEFIDTEDLPKQKESADGAKSSGTPFIGYYSPTEMESMANKVGLKNIRNITKEDMVDLYFADRKDDFLPTKGEDILIATT